MSIEDYRSALKLGQKEYRACLSRGEYPYLQVLDEILDRLEVQDEVDLGLVDIPVEQIAGTKTEGRRAAFARNFMPLLSEDTEFAGKWNALCGAHLEEGIREPISAYEFMNRFYVVEGNKRVSVLKFFGAVSIPGKVTRIVPKRRDTVENKIYFEFLDFYRTTQINYLWFSQPGRFQKLLELLDKREPWSQEDRSLFYGGYALFRKVFDALGGGRLPMTPGDALLAYLKIYGPEGFYKVGEGTVRGNLSKSWSEIAVQSDSRPVALVAAPSETPRAKKSLLTKLLDARPRKLKAAFLYQKTPEESKWTYAHEMGRRRLEAALPGRVETVARTSVAPEQAGQVMEEVIAQGCQVVFTTNPKLLPATLRCAVDHPEVRFLNCSLNMPHPSLRTYYGRMYEAKFLTGVIAGAASEKGRIGYIADYPILGVPASINAFALGARMVNPRAKIYLEWSSQRSIEGIIERFRSMETDVISNQDLLSPRKSKRDFGLYRVTGGGEGELMAAAVWHWGKFYELILRDLLDGGWGVSRENKAINYWWGLSAGVVGVHAAKALPTGTRRLVDLLRECLISGAFRPFAGELYTQRGPVRESLTPEQIVGMDWLAENVIGSIPEIGALTEEAQKLVAIQGIKKEGPA